MELILPELGFIALLLACGISAATAWLALAGYRSRWTNLSRLASTFTLVQFGLLLLAFGLLILAFLTDDFTLVYVAQHGHRQLPFGLKLAAVWGGHEGSLLLWVLCLSGWSALFAWRYRHATDPFFALTLALLAIIIAALLIFVLGYSDPFTRIFPPAIEGRDLNPMLQHIGLILHPPLLYLGYGGLTVAAAVALAALLRGEFNAAMAGLCWRWTVPAWSAMTAGIVLGSWWAYSELGWGGWWFWDPVENASLLPWLTASALMHSLYATRARGVFRHWSLLLAIFGFIFSLLGTLIVRSGVLVSVHAFALDNERAAPLFTLFIALSAGALALYGWRAKEWKPAARFVGWSRESWLLLCLLLFSAVVVIVLLGTLYPMLYTLFGWGKISVGAPYFNTVLLPFGLAMLLAIGLAAGSAWKRSPRWTRLRFFGSLSVGALAAVALHSHGIIVASAVALMGWVLSAQWLTSPAQLRRQLPMLLAHTGVGIFALGIVFSAGEKQEMSLNVTQGEQVSVAGYQFRFHTLNLLAGKNYTAEQAIIDISRDDQPLAQVAPERRFYSARRQLMIEPGIAWDSLTEWYVVMGEKTGDNRYAMRFYVQSGIRWVWFGAVIMMAGAMLGWWRGRRACA
ncbi:heme lyase CcmF/NrfE family subunit [Atlantibacter hermannii]|uniref:heme lyase CcmF/NrfE family subunit n=1 Tax=Atlantibacter hermannii TaxID=565 RepID=UPI002FF785DA